MSSSNSKMSTYVIISKSWVYYSLLRQIFLVAVKQDLCFSSTVFIRKKKSPTSLWFLTRTRCLAYAYEIIDAILAVPEKRSCNSYEMSTIHTYFITDVTSPITRAQPPPPITDIAENVKFSMETFSCFHLYGFREWRLSIKVNKIYQNVPQVLRKPDRRNDRLLKRSLWKK